MKNKKTKIFFGISWVAVLAAMLACNEIAPNPDKISDSSRVIGNDTAKKPVVSNPSNATTSKTACNLIAYQDSIVYLVPVKGDLKVAPLVTRKGEYGAYPDGMEIDHNTGVINVTKSETGIKYQVFFVPEKTVDTCFTYLTLTGIDYQSLILGLDKNENLSLPYYFTDKYDLFPEKLRNTEFDDGDDDDNLGDEPLPNSEVRPQGVEINKESGRIRWDESLRNGAFGTNPKSGDHRKFKIYYRLDDGSKKALNKIEIEVYYYDKKSAVPADLIQKVKENQDFYKQNFNNKGGRMMFFRRKPRPPQIVLVGRSLE